MTPEDRDDQEAVEMPKASELLALIEDGLSITIRLCYKSMDGKPSGFMAKYEYDGETNSEYSSLMATRF
jgi:hypothetical protein